MSRFVNYLNESTEAYNNIWEIWFDCKSYYFAKIDKYVWLPAEQKLILRT